MQEKRWAGLPAVALCAAATGVSYYLFARGVKLASGPLEADFCSAMFDVSCDSTLLSEYSKFLGMSFAGWGAVYYITLGVLLLASIGLRDLLHRQALSAAIVLNLGGLIVSGYLSWLMISGKVAICPLCFFTHLLNLALLPLLYLFRGSGPTSVRKDIGSGLTYIFAARGPSSTENTARTLAFVAVLLVGVASFEWFMLRSQPAPAESSAAPQQIIDNIMQAYLDENVVDIPVGPQDPRLGPADAPLQLVVFSDFECPSCKANEKRLERLTATFGDRLSIVFKNAPLSSDCNPNVLTNPHPYACGAAYAGIAAHMQGKFVPFHNALFHLRGAPTQAAIEEIARQLGLDVERLKRDMDSDAAKEKLEQDLALAAQLKVVLTPSMFLNGRPLNAATAMHVGIIANEILARNEATPE